ncbi:hypothetical protein BHM03_00059963 [Ensete ventricosum]|nr:hypothetical protein BHM03_00059963 [Ensete ventricosum]
MKEEQQIWFGITCLDAQAAAEAGLLWLRLPPGRIRRCGCCQGELGIAVVDLEVIGAFAGSAHSSPSPIHSNPSVGNRVTSWISLIRLLVIRLLGRTKFCRRNTSPTSTDVRKKKKYNGRILADREGRNAATADGYKSITTSARSRKMVKIYCRLTARRELALGKRL